MSISFPLINPLIDIYIFSSLISIILFFLEKYFFKIKPPIEEKERLKDLKKDLRKHLKNKDTKKAQSIQKELSKIQFAQMQKSFSPKVLLFRMVPYSMIIGLIRSKYSAFGIILDIGFIHFRWLGTYITFSIINSMILNKIEEKMNIKNRSQ